MVAIGARKKVIRLRLTPNWTVPLDWAYLAGMFLFYVYMLIPARVQEQISVFTLSAPEAAQEYGVGYPYLTILEVVMLGYVAVNLLLRKRRFTIGNWSFVAYVVVSFACVLLLWIRYVRRDEPDMWWDSTLATVRLVAIYGLFVTIPSDSRSLARTLQNALAIVFVSSLLLNLAGFGNRNTYSNEAGRMGVSGFEFTSASYFGFALALWSLTFSTGWRQVVLFLSGILGGVMGGGRNAVILFAMSLGVLVLLRRKAPLKALFPMLGGLAAAALLATVFVPEMIANVPTLRRNLDDPAYYATGVAPTSTALKYFPFLEHVPISDPSFVGRVNTWGSALDLLQLKRGVPLSSDWYVQQELQPLGVPSHSHNAYLQTILKFSVLAVPIWVLLLLNVWRGLRAGSPYTVILVFLLASLAIDYWLLVIKATFLLFALAKLNNDWVSHKQAAQS